VDEGKLDWDTPVREILPEFRLRDPVASEQATLRDLLTHRTGLPRHDWVHMSGHLDNAGMLAALRHLEPSKPFRSAYQYQNLMYLVAGIVLERISGQRWEDFIRDRILLPLGMERATTSLEEMVERHSDYAAPHAVLDGVQRRIPVRPINARPGGGICASIAEMAAYMRFHLDPIAGRGSLRLSPGAVAELTAPQIFIGRSDFSEFRDRHYGFGFDIGHYRGARCLDHGGGWSGYNCDLRLLPDHRSGVMVLTNGHDPGCAPLTCGAMDHLLGLEPLPWLERLSRPRATIGDRKLKDRSAREGARHRDTRPSHALADYANEHMHPAYGRVRRGPGGRSAIPRTHRHLSGRARRRTALSSVEVRWQPAQGINGLCDSA
jgi:CubicO group peptidase (beta-lactamase class C family)